MVKPRRSAYDVLEYVIVMGTPNELAEPRSSNTQASAKSKVNTVLDRWIEHGHFFSSKVHADASLIKSELKDLDLSATTEDKPWERILHIDDILTVVLKVWAIHAPGKSPREIREKEGR